MPIDRAMPPSHSHRRVLANWRSLVAAAICLLLVSSSGSAQQLTVREIEFLRDSGLMSPEDVASAYDRQLSNDKAQLYRSAVKKLMDGEDRKTVEAFLNVVDANAVHKEKSGGGGASLQSSAGASSCPQDVCKNMAICIPSDKENSRPFTCLCPDGYFGDTCQYDVVECVRQPCLHDGECRKDLESEKGYKCSCPVGYVGTHCENPVSQSDTKGASQDVSKDPVFLSYIATWCLLALVCCISIVISVEAERRILFERYKLYTALGYAVPFPRLEFSQMMTRVWRHYLCCLVWCIPEEDSDYPETNNSSAQTDAKP